MKICLEFIGILAGFICFSALLIIACDIDKAKKWYDLFEKRGRDDD